ncbi:MAG: hypothetical protein M4579_006489 [Chaenotheca gracillima]|nr:MAG: hypothetical protein M4579_006489 [Chaenotheca gracillima]
MRRRGNPVVPELSEKEDSRMGSVLDRVVPQIANRARRIQKDLADGKILLSPNEDDDENDDEDDDEDLDTEGDWGADVRINGQGQLEVYGPPPAVGGQRRAARKTASVWQIVPSLELDREETTPSRVRSGRREEERLEDTIIVHHDSPRSSSTASVLGSQRFLGHAKDKMLLEALDAAASTEPARQQQAGGAAVQQDSVGGAVRRTQQAWREQQRPIQAARQLQMETTHARARRRSNTNRQSSGENSIPESIEAEPEESESSPRVPKRPAQRTRRQSSPRIKSSAQISREYQETLRKREKQKNVYEPFPAAKPPPKLFATPQELRQKRLKEISEEDARKTAKGAGITRNAHDRHSRYINKTSGLIAKKNGRNPATSKK